MAIQGISAITLAVRDMNRSVGFYEKCGMHILVGGLSAEFTTLGQGATYVNLIRTAAYEGKWWGRVIFRVDDADSEHARLIDAGLTPEAPKDAPWGERYFHLTDPDGHELSFAELLKT